MELIEIAATVLIGGLVYTGAKWGTDRAFIRHHHRSQQALTRATQMKREQQATQQQAVLDEASGWLR